MTRTICFALGNLWRWEKDTNRDSLIRYTKKLDIDGIEFTFAKVEEVNSFKLSKGNKDYIQNLRYNSIHFPFQSSKDEKEIKRILDKVQKIYSEVNAKQVIIHPSEMIPQGILKDYNINVSTENMMKRKKIGIKELKRILQENKKIGLCLDVSHAYLWGKNETGEIVKNFEKRITQIHLSGTYRKKDHRSMRIVTKDFLESIEPIKKLKVPIIIEEDVPFQNERKIKEEVKFIRKMFS